MPGVDPRLYKAPTTGASPEEVAAYNKMQFDWGVSFPNSPNYTPAPANAGSMLWNPTTMQYGSTPTLPGAGGEYVPPGSPTARTNGAIEAAGTTPVSPLTGSSGATGTAPVTAQTTTTNASTTPALTSPLTGTAGATGGDVTGDVNSPLPGTAQANAGATGDNEQQTQLSQFLYSLLSGTGANTQGVTPTAQAATGAATTAAPGVSLPGLPDNGQNLQGLLIAQELNKMSGANPYSDLQPYAASALQSAFGPIDYSPEYSAYQTGEAMLKQSEAEQAKALMEDMNRRGILTSGITVDQLAGLAGKGQLARQGLASDLMMQRAASQPGRQLAALQSASGLYGLGTGANQQSFQNLASMMQAQQSLQGQEFGQQQQVYQQNLENYLRQITLQNELNKQARAEQLQGYNALMQLSGLGADPTSALGAALQGALSGQAQENSSGGGLWGALGSALPSLLALL